MQLKQKLVPGSVDCIDERIFNDFVADFKRHTMSKNKKTCKICRHKMKCISIEQYVSNPDEYLVGTWKCKHGHSITHSISYNMLRKDYRLLIRNNKHEVYDVDKDILSKFTWARNIILRHIPNGDLSKIGTPKQDTITFQVSSTDHKDTIEALYYIINMAVMSMHPNQIHLPATLTYGARFRQIGAKSLILYRSNRIKIRFFHTSHLLLFADALKLNPAETLSEIEFIS